jgi:hypothetical protein
LEDYFKLDAHLALLSEDEVDASFDEEELLS